MSKKIELVNAISIGIGGMVGGGIFAVLGLAVSLAHGGTPMAFLFAGIIALVTTYSYVKLSLKFPARGGTVRFINEGYGKTIFSGGINNLLWISYIIMLSLYASSFGSYGPNLWPITGTHWDFHIYTTFIVLIATLINYYSVKVVGQIESYAVIIKLVILISFVIIGCIGLFGNPNVDQLTIQYWDPPLKLIAGGMVIFVAYEGFELIANSVPDMKNPLKNVPRAYYISVIFVILLYIVIAFVTVGSLPFPEIAKARDYVLAEAAKPMLGQRGFIIITIAALISTFSAINASLYGGSQVSYDIAKDGELPHHFMAKLWKQPIGLLVTSACTFLAANFLPLESISTAGSVGFLFIFAMVNYSGFKLRKQTGGKAWIPILGTLLCVIALIALIVQQLQTDASSIIIALLVIVGCFTIEGLYKRAVR